MIQRERDTKGLIFYTQQAIGIATFIGGPMAAGYLIKENYRSLGDTENGNKAFIIGIVSTVLLFTGIFLMPEFLIDKIPNQILPAIYTGIIYMIVEQIQGKILNQHKENGNEFYSGWKAAGVGLVSLIIILIGVFTYIYVSTDEDLYEEYEKEMLVFSTNEKETLRFYDDINTRSTASLIKRLDGSIIPKWEENIQIIEKINAYENLPPELEERNVLLMEYSKLRLMTFQTLRKAIEEDSDKYAGELDILYAKIEGTLEKMN